MQGTEAVTVLGTGEGRACQGGELWGRILETTEQGRCSCICCRRGKGKGTHSGLHLVLSSMCY